MKRRDQLPTELVRRSDAGRFWQPIPHRTLADTLVQRLSRRGIVIQSEQWGLDLKGHSLIGGLQLALPGIPALPGAVFALGIRHSNDGRRALQISCGATIIVCQNGLITGTFVLKKRHTIGLDLATEIDAGIDRYMTEASQVQGVITRLQERTFTPTQNDALLMEAGRKRLLPWSAIGKVDQLQRTPTHNEFARWQGTGWGIYNAFNEVAKTQSPFKQLTTLDQFRELVLS